MLRRTEHHLESLCAASFLSQLIIPSFDSLVENVDKHAFLVGWNTESFRCCIVGSFELPLDCYNDLCAALELVAAEMAPVLHTLPKVFATAPTVLGEWIPANLHPSEYVPREVFQRLGIWITLTQDSSALKPAGLAKAPKLCSVYSLGCLYTTSCYMVQYEPVDTGSLRVFSLDDSALPNFSSITIASSSSWSNAQFSSSRNSSSKFSFTELDLLAAQINLSCDLYTAVCSILARQQNNLGCDIGADFHSPRSDDAMGMNSISCFRSPRLHAANSRSLFSLLLPARLACCFQTVVCRFFSFFRFGNQCPCGEFLEFLLVPMGHRWFTISRALRQILETKGSFYSLSGGIGYWLGLRASLIGGNTVPAISLADILLSAAFLSEKLAMSERVLIRCTNFSYSWRSSAPVRRQLWIDVCSYVSLTFIDTLLGCLVGAWLFHNSSQLVLIATQIGHTIQRDVLTEAMLWFRHSPAGIKLNPLITQKMGRALMIVLNNFGTIVAASKPVHLSLVRFVASAGCLGLTTQIVLLIDLIRLLTLHIALIHRILAWLHQGQLHLINSMWQLFQGKKVNVLRKRIDSCDYDKYQLLFGTVLFAIAFFLFPSFAVFFFLFSLVQLVIIFFLVALWSTAVALKEFPFYSLCACLWDPRSITHGAEFCLLSPENDFAVVNIRRPMVHKLRALVSACRGVMQVSAWTELLGSIVRSIFWLLGKREREEAHCTHGATPGATSLGVFRDVGASHVVAEAHTTSDAIYATISSPTLNNNTATQSRGRPVSYSKLASFNSKNASFGSTSAFTNQFNHHNPQTIHLHLSSRPLTFSKLFSAYAIYWYYLPLKTGLLMNVLRGMLFGWPALDVQLIQATLDLASPGVGTFTARGTSRDHAELSGQGYRKVGGHGIQVPASSSKTAETPSCAYKSNSIFSSSNIDKSQLKSVVGRLGMSSNGFSTTERTTRMSTTHRTVMYSTPPHRRDEEGSPNGPAMNFAAGDGFLAHGSSSHHYFIEDGGDCDENRHEFLQQQFTPNCSDSNRQNTSNSTTAQHHHFEHTFVHYPQYGTRGASSSVVVSSPIGGDGTPNCSSPPPPTAYTIDLDYAIPPGYTDLHKRHETSSCDREAPSSSSSQSSNMVGATSIAMMRASVRGVGEGDSASSRKRDRDNKTAAGKDKDGGDDVDELGASSMSTREFSLDELRRIFTWCCNISSVLAAARGCLCPHVSTNSNHSRGGPSHIDSLPSNGQKNSNGRACKGHGVNDRNRNPQDHYVHDDHNKPKDCEQRKLFKIRSPQDLQQLTAATELQAAVSYQTLVDWIYADLNPSSTSLSNSLSTQNYGDDEGLQASQSQSANREKIGPTNTLCTPQLKRLNKILIRVLLLSYFSSLVIFTIGLAVFTISIAPDLITAFPQSILPGNLQRSSSSSSSFRSESVPLPLSSGAPASGVAITNMNTALTTVDDALLQSAIAPVIPPAPSMEEVNVTSVPF